MAQPNWATLCGNFADFRGGRGAGHHGPNGI